jgi:hypothetical protein
MVSALFHNKRVVTIHTRTINKCGAVSAPASWITSRGFTSYLASSAMIMINEREKEKITCKELGKSKLRPHNMHVHGSTRNLT